MEPTLPSEDEYYFKDAKLFIEAFNHAKKYGLEYEFTQFFIDDLKTNGGDVEVAVGHGLYEWDL